MTTNTKLIPFTELFLSPENMRKAKTAKKADLELKASIKAQGLIQNLVVSAKTDKGYAVEAGGRRYVQISELINEGHFSSDEKFPVRVLKKGESAKEVSLAENLVRAPSNPVDEFEAFAYLNEKDGYSVGDIAARYGRSKRYVQQQLRLALVAPEIREAARSGDISIEELQAFTVTDNNELQLEVFGQLKKSYKSYNRIGVSKIKSMLSEEAPDNEDKRVRYVGLKAYKKAGGTTVSDLFENKTLVLDKELLDQLANEKLEAENAGLASEWKWVTFDANYSVHDIYYMPKIEKDELPKSHNLLKKLKKLEAKQEEVYKVYISEDCTEKTEEEYDELGLKIEDLEEEIESLKLFKEGEKQFAGCVVTISREGEPVVYSGLVLDEDVKQLNSFRSGTIDGVDGESTEEEGGKKEEKPMYSQAVLDEIGVHRTSVAQLAIAKDVKLGSDLMMFNVCFEVLGKWEFSAPLEVSVKERFRSSDAKFIEETKAREEFLELGASLDKGWIKEDRLESFKSFRKLSSAVKSKLLAYCSAHSFNPVTYNNSDAEQKLCDYIFKDTKTTPSDYFRPTAKNFFKRIPEPHFTPMATELLGESLMQEFEGKKRPYISEKLEQAVSEGLFGTEKSEEELKRWIPEIF